MSLSSDASASDNTTAAVRGTSVLYFQGLVSNLIGLAFAMLVTRAFATTDVGTLYALATFTGILATLASLSLPSAITRFIAETVGRGKVEEAKGIATSVFAVGLASSAMVAMTLVIILPSILVPLGINLNPDFPWLLLAIDLFCTSIAGYLASSLRGARYYLKMAGSLAMISVLRYGLSICSILLGQGVNGAVMGWAFGNIIGTGMLSILALSSLGSLRGISLTKLKPLAVYSAPLFASMIVGILNSNVDRIILLWALNVEAFAVYSMGLSITMLLTIAGSALFSVAFAEQATAYGGGMPRLEKVSEMVYRYTFLVYVPLAIIIATLSIPTVSLLFTTAYSDSFIVVAAICFVRAVFCYDLIANGFLLAVGRSDVLLKGSIVAFIAQIAISLLLISSLGLLGATIARCMMVVVLALYPTIVISREFKIHPDLRFQFQVFTAGLLMVPPSLLIISYYDAIIALPLAISISMITYLLGLRAWNVVRSEDIEIMVLLLPQRIRNPFRRLGMKLVSE